MALSTKAGSHFEAEAGDIVISWRIMSGRNRVNDFLNIFSVSKIVNLLRSCID